MSRQAVTTPYGYPDERVYWFRGVIATPLYSAYHIKGKSLTEIGFSEKTTRALKQLNEADKALIEKVLMHGLISGLSHNNEEKGK